jgi:hypothetical protein
MYGTHQNSDTLETFLNDQNLRVTDFGEDRTYEAITMLLEAHNAITMELRSGLTETSTDSQRLYGGTDTVEMEDLDEYGTPDAQKVAAGENLGFPLRKTGAAVQWTRTFLMNAKVSQINATTQAVMTADLKRVSRDIRRAYMYATNYTFKDRFATNLNLPVKRLLNADGDPIPPSPYGDEFDGDTHTHYLATSSFTKAGLTALVETVLEHNANANIRVEINRAQETALRVVADFPDFLPYTDARLIQATDVTRASGDLDMNRVYDRAIGVYGPAEVWVKPYIPANYLSAYDMSMPPLVWRVPMGGSGNLELVFEDEAHPLRARGWERNYGVGVWRRHSMAMLYVASGTWADPSIS